VPLAAILARLAAILAQLAAILLRLTNVLAHLLPRELDQIHALALQVGQGQPALERGELPRDAHAVRLGASLGVGIPHVIATVAAVISLVMLVIDVGPRAAVSHVAADLALIRAELLVVAPHLRAITGQLVGALGQLGPEQVMQPGIHGGQRSRVHGGAGPIKVREHGLQRGHIPPVIHALAGVLTQLAVILGTLDTVASRLAMSGTASQDEGSNKGGSEDSNQGIPLGMGDSNLTNTAARKRLRAG
jgi:hypothetical protein